MNRIFNIPAATIATFLWAGASGAVTLAPSPAGPFDVGNTITVDMSTPSGFPEFFGFQGDLSFDTDVLSLQGVTVGSAFDFPFIGPEETPPTSLVSGGAVQNALPSDEVLLASFAFEALAFADDTPVEFDLLVISEFAEAIVDTTVGTSITVGMTGETPVEPDPTPTPAPIPLPATVLMLIAALAGLPTVRFCGRRS